MIYLSNEGILTEHRDQGVEQQAVQSVRLIEHRIFAQHTLDQAKAAAISVEFDDFVVVVVGIEIEIFVIISK